MISLKPDFTFNSTFDITPEFFKEHNITAVVSDIDNTLVTYGDDKPTEECIKWINSLKESGIQIALLSNNTPKRVKIFNEQLGFHSYGRGLKPLRRYAQQLIDSMGAKNENVCIIGDQIFTDVLCGKRMGIKTVLVKPIKDKTDRFTKLKRMLEKKLLSNQGE